MKKLLAFIAFILFLLLLYFGWHWYKDTMVCCADITKDKKEQTIAPLSSEPIVHAPLEFLWNNPNAITSKDWIPEKAVFLNNKRDGQVLQIIGPYFTDEVNNTTFENIGLARADAIRKLFLDSVDSTKIETVSKIIDFKEGVESKPFEMYQINWLTRNKNVKEFLGKTHIHFPFNSSQKLANENINDYLEEVKVALEGNDKKVLLIGHADNSGNSERNTYLGMERAKSIQGLLLDMGIDATRIEVDSKGDTDPIASNKTKEGRGLNRRVELQIN